MIKTIVLATVAVATLLSSCSGSGSDDKADGAAAAAPTTTPAKTTAAPTTPPALQYKLLDKGDLEDALLTVEDFPTGFSQDAESQQEDSKTFCDYREPVKPKVRASRDFTKGAGMDVQAGAVILRQYESVDAANTAFDALTNELKTCRKDTIDGDATTHTVTNAPKVGDDSIGVRTESGGVTALSNYALVGPTLVYAGTGSLLSGDADEAAGLLVKQVDAYVAAANG